MAYDHKAWYVANAVKHNRNNGKPKNHDRWTSEELNFLIECYESIGPKNIAIELGRNKNGVINKATELRRSGILLPKLSCLGVKRYSHRINSFENINTASSYWAGWIASDGHLGLTNGTYLLSITLMKSDRQVLETFQNWLEYTGPLIDYECYLKKTDKTYPGTKLGVCGAKKIVNDLNTNFNIPIGYKSLILEPPNLCNNNALPFIKGYIEGDGSLILDSYNRLTIQVLGTENVLHWIKHQFELVINKKIDTNIYKQGNIFVFRFMKDSPLIAEALINIQTPYNLNRKWDKINVLKQRI